MILASRYYLDCALSKGLIMMNNKAGMTKNEKIEHHTKAAQHSEKAAKHHHEAILHVKGDECDKACAETIKAISHALHAEKHRKAIVKAHASHVQCVNLSPVN